MHYLYFVHVRRKEADTSIQAQKRATRILEDEGFVYSDGYFSGKCDWYEIGGRWQAEFQFISNPKLINWWKEHKTGWNGLTLHKNEQELQTTWEEAGGTDTNFISRLLKQRKVYADNAAHCYEKTLHLLAKKYPQVEVFSLIDSREFTCKQLPDLLKSGQIDQDDWLVVIDYHR